MRRGYHSAVLGEFFPTAKSLLQKCREILDAYMDPAWGLNAELNSTDANFFYELVMKRDPERIKRHGGLRAAYRSHRFGVLGRHLKFVYEDGFEDLIGWSKMVSHTGSDGARVTSCMRDAIREQIEQALDSFLGDNGYGYCPMSQRLINRSGLGCEDKAIVHHEGLSFSNLRDLWLAWHGMEMKDVVLVSRGAVGGSRIADPRMESSWQEFHVQNSKLVVVSDKWHKEHHTNHEDNT